jgi:hypothetical protein
MRAASLDAVLYRSFRDVAPTKQQLEVLGNQVNAFTGSGGLRSKESLARGLLFAPNYYLSLLKTVSGQPIAKALLKHEGKVARAITTEYVRALASLGVLLGVRQVFFGDDKRNRIENTNLLDPTTGTIRMPSGVSVDLTQGRAAWVSLGYRMYKGQVMRDGKIKKEQADRALLNFIRGRLSQEIRTGIMATSGKDYFGKEMTVDEFAAAVVTPLSWNSMDEIIKAEGMTRGSFLQLMNFVFGNVRAPYEPPEKEKKRKGGAPPIIPGL